MFSRSLTIIDTVVNLVETVCIQNELSTHIALLFLLLFTVKTVHANGTITNYRAYQYTQCRTIQMVDFFSQRFYPTSQGFPLHTTMTIAKSSLERQSEESYYSAPSGIETFSPWINQSRVWLVVTGKLRSLFLEHHPLFFGARLARLHG